MNNSKALPAKQAQSSAQTLTGTRRLMATRRAASRRLLSAALAEARTYTPRQICQHRYDAKVQAEALRERGA